MDQLNTTPYHPQNIAEHNFTKHTSFELMFSREFVNIKTFKI